MFATTLGWTVFAGDKLGPYEILASIGAGGWGKCIVHTIHG